MSIEIIRHELGHWLTAKALGFEVGRIKIERMGTGKIKASSQSFPQVPLFGKSRKILKHCERRICVLLGGVAAELLFEEIQTSERSLELLEETGEDDKQKMIELLYLKASIRKIKKDNFEEYESNKINKCWETTMNILKERKDDIKRASEKINKEFSKNERTTFTKEEIEILTTPL